MKWTGYNAAIVSAHITAGRRLYQDENRNIPLALFGQFTIALERRSADRQQEPSRNEVPRAKLWGLFKVTAIGEPGEGRDGVLRQYMHAHHWVLTGY
jgi:hypothetical protein